YFAVLEEGALAAGDAIRLEARAATPITVRDVTRVVAGVADADLRRRCAALETLPQGLREQIARPEGRD
ncbi:MOSC domain-containing protein, partial [bacterium]|nr:MOSC domain-containing protein [bacterium]